VAVGERDAHVEALDRLPEDQPGDAVTDQGIDPARWPDVAVRP